MKKALYFLMAIIMGFVTLFMLLIAITGAAMQGPNGLVLIIFMISMLFLALTIRCAISAIRIKPSTTLLSAAKIIRCEYCGRILDESKSCPSCGAHRP